MTIWRGKYRQARGNFCMLIATCATVACTSEAHVPSSSAKARVLHVTESSLQDTAAWNVMTQDVTIQAERQNPDGRLKTSSPPIKYHVERTRATNGSWRTEIQLTARPGVSGAAAQTGRIKLTGLKFVDSGDGSVPHLEGANGFVLTPSRQAIDRAAQALMPQARYSALDEGARRIGRTTPTRRGTEVNSGQWIEGLMATPALSELRHQSFERQFGSRLSRDANGDHYRRVNAGVSDEVDVDPLLEVPIKARHFEGAKLVDEVTFHYEVNAARIAVRSSIEASHRDRQSGDVLHTVVSYDNLRLEKRIP